MRDSNVQTETRSADIPSPFSSSNEELGLRLRKLRSEQKMTILELAAKAGISAGIISQIERGKSNPSMKTLQSLRGALGVNLWEFLERPSDRDTGDDPSFVRRRNQRPRMVLGTNKLVKELLSPHSDENLRFMFVTMPPGSASEDMLVGSGQKGGYVVSGTVELTVGNTKAQIGEGDSFQFRCDTNHRISNNTGSEAKLLWIMSVLDTHL